MFLCRNGRIHVTIRRDERLTPSTYNEEKAKHTSLCLLCPYVKKDVFRSQYEKKMNVFVKPNEQCRACSNMVMARKRTFRGMGKERFR